MKLIRVGIDLDYVIRDINRQIVKYYQKEYNTSFDLDNIDYSDDVLKTICKFKSKKEKCIFLYEQYPLEIFGHAGQVDRFLSRDLNFWLDRLKNQEEYDVEVFFYSMKEYNITIQSSYFFLSKIGSRVRKVIFPENYDELADFGDVFITSYLDNANELNKREKPVILINTKMNGSSEDYSVMNYGSFREFLDDKDNLNNIIKIKYTWREIKKKKSFLTWIKSWILSLTKTKRR